MSQLFFDPLGPPISRLEPVRPVFGLLNDPAVLYGGECDYPRQDLPIRHVHLRDNLGAFGQQAPDLRGEPIYPASPSS